MSQQESDNLERIAQRSLYSSGVMAAAIVYCFRIFQRHLAPGAILELGPAEGVMTELLSGLGRSLTAVEGSRRFCEELRSRFPEAQIVHGLFESFEPRARFGNVVLGHVLEHVDQPGQLLRHVRDWLAPDGRVFAAVPNARSLHRQAAVLMGMLPQESALNERDRLHGHRRVFDPESFRAVFTQAGLRIEIFGGYWLKPISNAQIEQQWDASMVDAFMQLGERYPDVAGEIYLVASRP